MNNNVVNALCFIGGAAVGIIGAVTYLKPRYDKMYEESVESVKEAYGRKSPHKALDEDDGEGYSDPTPEGDIVPVASFDRTNYSKTIAENSYISKSEDEKETKGPYVVSEVEFNDNMEYDVYECHYFADGILTDDCYDKIEDPEGTVGTDFPNHFGENEGDVVYVRDDKRECDYEILLDARKYSEVRATMPPTDVEE